MLAEYTLSPIADYGCDVRTQFNWYLSDGIADPERSRGSGPPFFTRVIFSCPIRMSKVAFSYGNTHLSAKI